MNKTGKIPEKNPFRVPEGYMENLNERILDTTLRKESFQPAIRPFRRRIRPYLAIAASLAIIITLAYGAYNLINRGNIEPSLSEVIINELPYTIFDDIDLSVIESKLDNEYAMFDLSEISKSEIIDYLLLENIDESEIFSFL